LELEGDGAAERQSRRRSGQIYVHYNLSQFPAILQPLREEQPV
jgi:hypothetical protein